MWATGCGSRGEINRTHCRVRGTSHAVFANKRCTAVCMEVRAAHRGYPESTGSGIHMIVEKRNTPQDHKKGKALDTADKNTLAVRRLLAAQ